MLTRVTERLKFLVAFRLGFISPTLAAQMAATFQRQSRGRLLLNVVTGGESAEQRAYGDFLGKDERYERTGGFLDIVTRLWQGEAVTASHRARTRFPSSGWHFVHQALGSSAEPGTAGSPHSADSLPEVSR